MKMWTTVEWRAGLTLTSGPKLITVLNVNSIASFDRLKYNVRLNKQTYTLTSAVRYQYGLERIKYARHFLYKSVSSYLNHNVI